jgi:hypothetical protein
MDKMLEAIKAFPGNFGSEKLYALLIALVAAVVMLSLLSGALRRYRGDHFVLHSLLGALVGIANFFLVVQMSGLKLAGPLPFWWAVAICALVGAILGLITKYLFEQWDLEDLFDDGLKGVLLAVGMSFLLFSFQLWLAMESEVIKNCLG